MRTRSLIRILIAVLAVATLPACGGSSSGTTLPPGYYITISTLSFSPANLAAPSGATITVVNNSTTSHSVTQQAAVDAFTMGAMTGMTPFDTGMFSNASKTFTLPTGLAEGTVLYYYCRNHTSMMVPSTGRITITAAAAPSGGGGSGY
jgi:plastocyanin